MDVEAGVMVTRRVEVGDLGGTFLPEVVVTGNERSLRSLSRALTLRRAARKRGKMRRRHLDGRLVGLVVVLMGGLMGIVRPMACPYILQSQGHSPTRSSVHH